MVYPNIHEATTALSRKLYTFAGHSIDSCHKSYCFDTIARGIDYLNREPAAKALDYEATIWAAGKALPVIVSVKGTSLFAPVEVIIQMAAG